MSNKLQQDHVPLTPKEKDENIQYLNGRGAQINTKNRFLKEEKTKVK